MGSPDVTDDLLADFDLRRGAPAPPPPPLDDAAPPSSSSSRPSGTRSARQERILTEALQELQEVLGEIDERKRSAAHAEDWRQLMLYIAMTKPRIAQRHAEAKAIFYRQYGDSYDANLQTARGSGGSKGAEIRARAEASAAQAVYEQLERVWEDLRDLLWTIKFAVSSGIDEQRTPHVS